MSDGKGKGRARPEKEIDKTQTLEDSQSSSILSRVAASATGLARDALSTPNSNELRDHAASAFANAGKGPPSATNGGGSAWAENSAAVHNPRSRANEISAFKPGHEEAHVRQSDGEFASFLNGIDSFVPSEHGGGSPFDEAWSRSRTGAPVESSNTPFRTVTEQEKRDGEEVLSILSNPGTMDAPFEAAPAEESFDWGLSAEQLSQLRAMTKDIFPAPEQHKSPPFDHPLNLVPSLNGTTTKGSTLHPNATSEPSAARHAWMEQWGDVLTRYTDEVWGDLLPLVKEARREVEDIENDPATTEQPKALRRLGAILGHLRKF